MYKAALFDLDGTLTDSMNLSAQAFIHTLRIHLNKEFTPEGIFALFGPGEEEIFLRLDPNQAQDMMETFLRFYRAHHCDYAQIYPDVLPMLDYFKEKQIPMAVITGKGLKPATITVEECGLAGYFNYLVTGSCVAKHKPDPEGILQVLDCLQVQPHQAFYLGDSPGDIETARRAGVDAIAALWGARDQELVLKQGPNQAFKSSREFLEWVRGSL